MRVVDHGCLGQTGCYQNWPGLRPFPNDTDLGMATTTTSFYWHDYNSLTVHYGIVKAILIFIN